MARQTFDAYIDEVRSQRKVWEQKPVLRELYRHWYLQCVAAFSPLRPVVEIGAGCGNFKEFFPSALSSDVFRGGDWIDFVTDAQNLSLARNRIGNLIAFDVTHHLQRPLEFLRQAMAALKPGGRLVMCEPAISFWSRLVYRFHHEPIDMNWKLFELDGSEPDPDPGHTFANMGIPELLFWKYRERTLQCLPATRFLKASKSSFILYPLTGGFGYKSFVPRAGFSRLLKLEDAITRRFGDFTAMRMLVALEKTAAA